MSKKYLLVILVPIIALTIASAILRFYKLPMRQYWMVDEERDAFIVKKIIKDKHPTLIGGALPGGFYLAPGYFYISAIFYFFTNLNPVGMGYIAAFFGTLSTPLIFYVTKKLFTSRVAFLATLFLTFSYLTVIYNRTWWPLTFSPLISLLAYFLIYQIIRTKNLKLTILLSIIMIVAVQTDPSNFSTLLLVAVLWFIYKLPLKNRYVILSLLLFFLSHIPLVIFDLRHDFLNSRASIKFFIGGTGAGINFDPKVLFETFLLLPRSFARFLAVFGNTDVAVQIAPSPVYTAAKFAAIPAVFLFGSIAIILAFFADQLKNRSNLPKLIISLHLAIAISGIAAQNFFFGNWNFEWLMQVLFPAYAIIAAVVTTKLISSKFLKAPIYLLIFIFAVYSTEVIITSPNSYNLDDKTKAVKFAIEKVGDEKFFLDSIGENFSWGGYRYLFYLYGKEPQASYIDPIFAGWLYEKPAEDQKAKLTVVMSNPDFYEDQEFNKKYSSHLSKAIAKEKFGKIEVIIVRN